MEKDSSVYIQRGSEPSTTYILLLMAVCLCSQRLQAIVFHSFTSFEDPRALRSSL
jgi:hypothetical protein